jgi:hypothetical protein
LSNGSDFEPVWPELRPIIASSPVQVVDGRFFIVELPQDQQAVGAFALFNDGTESTAIVNESELANFNPIRSRGPYTMMRFVLSSPFEAPGFLASAALSIARAKVNQLIYSTYSFDYVLVREADCKAAQEGLGLMGFKFIQVSE